MYIRKISNKASIFLNHKHFHPGNSKNREKLWLAEEKKKEEERKQEELLKKRKKELEIEELKREFKKSNRDLRGLDSNRTYPISEAENVTNGGVLDNEKIKNILMNKKGLSSLSSSSSLSESSTSILNKPLSKSKLYAEDVFLNNHQSVWGSYFDLVTHKWGYRCCRNTNRDSVCNSRFNSDKNTNLNVLEKHSDNCLHKNDAKHTGQKNKFKGKQYKGVSEFLNILKST
ncbi:hypothetical protein RS030_6862 [Cryptosporidium xiaoi]|uniref:Pre-mRNA-splicing factor SLU7 n=1 Tax=Cryptosporidium xiaoi TaxID=659607 RepID=A0AAV9XUF6_9CRYT